MACGPDGRAGMKPPSDPYHEAVPRREQPGLGALRKRAMGRVAKVLAVLIVARGLLPIGPARAAEEESRGAFPDEMRGMVVIRLPFGGGSVVSAPRVGFDFHMQNRSELDYLEENRDPETGRRLPEIDAGRMRTWPFDPPVFRLPEERPGEPEPDAPRAAPRHRG